HYRKQTRRQKPCPSVSRRCPLSVDYFSSWYSVCSIKDVSTHQRCFLPTWNWVLRLYLRYCRSFYKHGCAAFYQCGTGFSDRVGLRTNHTPTLLASPRTI